MPTSILPDKTHVVFGYTLSHSYTPQQGETSWLRPDSHVRSYGYLHWELTRTTRLLHGTACAGRMRGPITSVRPQQLVCLLTFDVFASKRGPVIPTQPTQGTDRTDRKTSRPRRVNIRKPVLELTNRCNLALWIVTTPAVTQVETVCAIPT